MRTERDKRAVASERCSTTGAGDADTAGAGAIKSTIGAAAGNTAGVGEKCSITGAGDWDTAGAGAVYSTTGEAWHTAGADATYSTHSIQDPQYISTAHHITSHHMTSHHTSPHTSHAHRRTHISFCSVVFCLSDLV